MRGCNNMQRTRRHWNVFVIVTFVLCIAQVTHCNGNSSADSNSVKKIESKEAKTPEHIVPVGSNPKIILTTNDTTKTIEQSKSGDSAVPTSKLPVAQSIDKKKSPDSATLSPPPEQIGGVHATSLNSGALLRGFFVFVGLSVIALAYMLFRSFRLNKNPTQMVRKYGILAHKQDIEMRPLPLDEEDDDDTTVFDVSGLAQSRPQS